ncbi:3-keto-disaccharide hydrolase [Novipirellula artificiosorum]|uniref:3-keto-alpha-glucoside-1,2-lyase/3-keto-2-hydroxy-glucal hydratase domain-containing protein n=1 Tax=Novipirellula artificiosorum TaxID=2528016 RepID=A0A5C6DFX3_9BACT|nr:DUF1080 domain-containing protein [Novipirellula artificiosorum]TWU36183.1 hypothetical protein Poly41_39370 [Novipirellula artificiosorum]
MKHDFHAILFTSLMACLTCMPASAEAPPEGFRPLFDGKTLDGWQGRPHFSPIELAKMSESDATSKITDWTDQATVHWTVENGELVNDGAGPYLVTSEDFGDYELLIEYKTVQLADSGIYLKGTPQVQIWDSTNESARKLGADKGSGGLWNNSAGAPGKDPSVLADKPFGEWNSFRIIQVGARTSVWLNDKMVVDHAIMENYWDRQSPLFATGPIELQTHGGEIRWRNLFVREYSAEEANDYLSQHRSEGFESIFNGSDLSGWKGPLDDYEVVEGAIRCKPGRGGLLLFDKEYSNFVARVEFRLPPGGNNGLALRSPGVGDTAYNGMCELQVLDSEHPKFAKLDARQYHGSAYGMAAAHRGYLRETGEWNFQEVTVDGSRIKVELNGNVILDTDLSEVTDFMADRAHPGKDRASGYFGFAGHNDPVEFRKVSIKQLPSPMK